MALKILRPLVLLSLTSTLHFAAFATTQQGKMYTSVGMGYSALNVSTVFSGASSEKITPAPYGIGVSGGVHYALTDSIRLGVDAIVMRYLRDKAQIGSGLSLQSDKVIFNNIGGFGSVYYDIKTKTRFTPYVTLGVGMMRSHVKSETFRNSASSSSSKANTKLAFQGGGGIAYSFSTNMDLEFGYKAFKRSEGKGMAANDAVSGILNTHKPSMTHYGFIGGKVMF